MTIQNAYRKLVEQDAANQVLGAVDNYYRLYQREELERLAQQQQPNPPQSDDEWVISLAQHADLAQLKYPVVSVQEYGWCVSLSGQCRSDSRSLTQLPRDVAH
ncbi:hypothetical protein HND97_18495 [Vibrio cholerae]|nr:hypothetical protein HND97_18495 [Vibrio cholerae]